MEYASKGLAGTALGLAVGGLGTSLLNGGLNGLLGGSGDNASVNRYEAKQNARIAELETEVKLRDANFYTVTEMGKLRDYVDHRMNRIENELCEQKVYNATNTATISCISGQIAQLMSLTKLVIPNASICPGWDTTSTT